SLGFAGVTGVAARLGDERGFEGAAVDALVGGIDRAVSPAVGRGDDAAGAVSGGATSTGDAGARSPPEATCEDRALMTAIPAAAAATAPPARRRRRGLRAAAARG